MLSWIPLLGPIIQGISSIFTGYFSEKVQLAATAANVTIAETNASAQIIATTNDDICLRIMRDLVCFPVVVWSSLIGWDTIIANHWSWLKFNVAAYPASVGYIPYAVLVFLLGNIGLNMWNRK